VWIPVLEYSFRINVSIRSPVHTISRKESDLSEGSKCIQDFASQRTVRAAIGRVSIWLLFQELLVARGNTHLWSDNLDLEKEDHK